VHKSLQASRAIAAMLVVLRHSRIPSSCHNIAVRPPVERLVRTSSTTKLGVKLSSATGDFSHERIEALDGLRGLAVLAVMFYHFGHVTRVSSSAIDAGYFFICMAGWVGVDLFFVLSGFLITRILLENKGSATYFGTFYKRRILRIFPLYYAYLAFIFLIYYPIAYGHSDLAAQEKIRAVSENRVWFFLYLSNVKQVMSGAFFGANAGHLWSLAIEEQYYLFWPLVIRWTSPKALSALCGGMFLFAFLTRIYLYSKDVPPDSIYVFTLCRLDSLAVGSYLAVRSVTKQEIFPAKLWTFTPFYAGMVIVGLFLFGPRPETSPVVYTIGLSIIALFFGSLVGANSSPHASFFNRPILRFFGKYSYALYMFHPLVRSVVYKAMGEPKVFLQSQLPWQFVFMAVCFGLSVLLALLSWRLLEKPILGLKRHVNY
jgi:peptidoglycan/LPS O-acetylase OafA/YrhL